MLENPGTLERLSVGCVVTFSSDVPESFFRLLKFHTSLENARCPEFSEPVWFVQNLFGARFGKGSKELLAGHSVDPKCNPIHQHSVQYLADMGLLMALSRAKSMQSFVSSVSYFDDTQESLNNSIFQFGRPCYICLIALTSRTRIALSENEYPAAERGSVIILPVLDSCTTNRLRVVHGATIAVVFGSLDPVCNTKSFVNAINAQMSLFSVEYSDSESFNRKTGNRSLFLPQIACPDCRRPIQIRKTSATEKPGDVENQDSAIVTVICDEEEAACALETGLCAINRYTQRLLYASDSSFISSELRAIYTNCETVEPLLRWSKKRGIKDYSVPQGFVSPALIPKGRGLSSKDTMYTIVQVIGRPEIWGKKIWLVDPSGENGIELVPTKSMYRQMISELREWSHPCHKARSSAVCFIREWIRAYC